MNAQEILTQIDHIITEIDLELHEWQEAMDMMSFIGSNAQFAMWTDEKPHRVVTSRNITLLPLQGITDVRVMHFTKDGWEKVGTAKINRDGNFVAQIDRDIPGFTDINTDFSIDGVGNMKPVVLPGNPPFESFNKPLTRDVYDFDKKNRYSLKQFGVENHPFFNTKEEN